MVQKIGPKELAQRALTERRALDAENAAKAERAAARAAKPNVAALRAATADIPVKRRPKAKHI